MGAILVCLIVHEPGEYFFDFRWQETIAYAIIGLSGAVLTELGDLIESLIKRKLDVKDLGRLLPGHGGVMDRIDGLMFASPLIAFIFCVVLPSIAS